MTMLYHKLPELLSFPAGSLLSQFAPPRHETATIYICTCGSITLLAKEEHVHLCGRVKTSHERLKAKDQIHYDLLHYIGCLCSGGG